MRIIDVKVKPYEFSIQPGLKFDVKIEYRAGEEAIVGIEGWIQSEDDKVLAELREQIRSRYTPQYLASKYTYRDNEYFRIETYGTELIALLDRSVVDYLEKARLKHPLRRVKIDVILNVKVVKSLTQITHFHVIHPEKIPLPKVEVSTKHGRQPAEGFVLYKWAGEKYYLSPYSNLWVLSSSEGKFLEVSVEVLTHKIEIPSDEWIAEFAPKLGLGKYFIVEIPEGDEIKEAWEHIKKAEECYRNWDSKGAYAHCREVGYLLDRVIKERFGKDSFVYEKWSRAYSRFEKLASLDLHLEELKAKKGILPDEVKVGREDVEHLLIVTKALIKYAEELLK